ncbi:MAG: hypothetical protein ACI4T6_06205 [Candidatus Flemingiibacterium sp.]
MSKFKVGDTVKVVGRVGIMNMFPTGTVGNVLEADGNPLVQSLYPIWCNERSVQYVSDCDLELVSSASKSSKADKSSKAYKMPSEPDWKILIVPDGDKTSARFYDGGKCAMSASVRRYHKDSYDVFIAADEAVKKLFGKQDKPIEQTEPEKPKGYTGKAMCFTDLHFQPFTKGKIYDFVDGNVTDDDGQIRPSPLNDEWSAQEKERWLSQFFIKVVE